MLAKHFVYFQCKCFFEIVVMDYTLHLQWFRYLQQRHLVDQEHHRHHNIHHLHHQVHLLNMNRCTGVDNLKDLYHHHFEYHPELEMMMVY